MDAPLITTSLRRSSEPVPGSLSGRNRRDHRSSAYSWRSESIGLSLEARSAGAVPGDDPAVGRGRDDVDVGLRVARAGDRRRAPRADGGGCGALRGGGDDQRRVVTGRRLPAGPCFRAAGALRGAGRARRGGLPGGLGARSGPPHG